MIVTRPPAGSPRPESGRHCVHCGRPVVPDDIVPGRFRHIDRYGVPAGWLCPLPHMTLAEPGPEQPAPGVPQPRSEPQPESGRHSPPADAPPTRRRPTPITPREDRPDAPPEWPLPPGDTPWWETP